VNPQKYHHISDSEILERFYYSSDNEWLGILLQRYTLLLFGVCMKYLKDEEEAKDAVQQIFLKALGELQKYKVEYFKSWLYMVARNYCLMKLREKNKQPLEINERLLATPAPEEENKNSYLEKDLTISMMTEALAELTEEQQQCIRQFYLEKKSYQQITEITGYNLLQVKSYIQNGKRNLKIILQKRMRSHE
jgi:RNA polymerase sigma-70 factor (ECF subfamily)